MKNNTKTKMTTFIKTKFKISEEIGLLWESTISDLKSPSNFQVKEKKLFKSVHKQGNWTFVVREWFEGKYNIGFVIPIKFPSK